MKRILVFSILIIIPAMLFVAFWLARPAASALTVQEVEGVGVPWYNPEWHYRRPMTVTNGSTALTNYQVLVKLDNTNFDFTMANADGSDLRVTSSDGETALPFWIESWSAPLAYVWIKVPSLPATSKTTVYLYFGNTAAASASRGDLTFGFFEDSWCQFPGNAGCGNPVLSAGQNWWETTTGYPTVFEDTSFLPSRPRYHMLYSGYSGSNYSKGYAWSSDLNSWTEYDGGVHPPNPNPVLGVGYGGNANVTYGDTIKVGSTYYMFAIRGVAQRIESTDLISWDNFADLSINSGSIGSGMAILKEGDGITPIVVNGEYWMVYFTDPNPGSMYLAHSSDLQHWTSTGAAILTPTTWDALGLWTPSFIQLDNTYYIYYQGQVSANNWDIGYAKADATGGVPPPSNPGSWTKSADAVIKREAGSWDSAYAIHPMLRRFSNGTYYVFYSNNSAIGYAYSTSPEGLWTKLGTFTPLWNTLAGSPSVSGGNLTLNKGVGIRSTSTFQYQAIGFRANYPTSGGMPVWGGFITPPTSAPFTLISTKSNSGYTSNLYLRNYGGAEVVADLGSTWYNNYHVYELQWNAARTRAIVDHSTTVTLTTNVPTTNLPATFYNYMNTAVFRIDWAYVRQYRPPEPTTTVRNYSDRQETRAIGLGANNFGYVFAGIYVTDTGTALSSVQIVYYRNNHPDAPPKLQNGQYWEIIPNTVLTDYNVSLTLRHSYRPDANDKLCFYTGSGMVWDCAASSFDPAQFTITRNDLHHLSEWAVEENSPTAIGLKSLRAIAEENPAQLAGYGVALISTFGVVAVIWYIRRKHKIYS